MPTVSIVFLNRPTTETLSDSSKITTDHWWVDTCFSDPIEASKYVIHNSKYGRQYKIETYPVLTAWAPLEELMPVSREMMN